MVQNLNFKFKYSERFKRSIELTRMGSQSNFKENQRKTQKAMKPRRQKNILSSSKFVQNKNSSIRRVDEW